MKTSVELESYVLKSVINKILKKEGHHRYIIESDLNQLRLSSNEMRFILQALKKRNIFVQLNDVIKENRIEILLEQLGEEVEEDSLEKVSILSKLEYSESGELIAEDYERLDGFLEEVLIPKYAQLKRFYEKKCFNKINRKQMSYWSIQLCRITDLKLNEEEFKHVMDYLNHLGIRVGGSDPILASMFENYDHVRDHSRLDVMPKVSEEVKRQKLEEYQKNKSLELRNEIVLMYSHIVEHVAYKYVVQTGFKIQELESYGYEGLIYAVERFDPQVKEDFFSYAYSVVTGYVLNGIATLAGFYNKDKNSYWEYFRYQRIAEKECQTSLEEEPELIVRKVAELLIRDGKIASSHQEEYCNLIFSKISDLVIGGYEASDDEGVVENRNLVEDAVITQFLKEEVREVLDKLDEREREILERRYGLNNMESYTLRKLGEMYHLSCEGVRFIENKTLKKIRKSSSSKKLREYL